MFFENSSLKSISGQNMSDPLKWSLTDDSQFLQAAILKDLTPYTIQQTHDPLYNSCFLHKGYLNNKHHFDN